MVKFEVIPETSEVMIEFVGSEFGRCKLWCPEAISTPRGLACVYPRGMNWVEEGNGLRLEASVEQLFGPGNVTEVQTGVLECCGVKMKREPSLPWSSSLQFEDNRVEFSLSVQNPHEVSLKDVAAMLCLKFMDADWWSPDSCFMKTGEGIKNISQSPWIEGQRPFFQKWNIGPDTPFDNPIGNGIWTSNSMRADAPCWMIKHKANRSGLIFKCENAYYIHSNRNNPCNDIALKFGEINPGQTVCQKGYLEFLPDFEKGFS